MRRASPPLRRGLPSTARQGLLFVTLALVSFLLGFSLGEGAAPGLRPLGSRSPVSMPVIGAAPDGPLELTVFVDYSSPLALRTHRVLERVDRAYGERVATRLRYLPRKGSASAWRAHALLARAELEELPMAERDGWVDRALELSSAHLWSPAWVSSWVAEQGTLVEESVLQGPGSAEILARDRAIARSFGVRRAPAIVVAGRRIDGPVPYEVLREAIDRQLSQRSALSL